MKETIKILLIIILGIAIGIPIGRSMQAGMENLNMGKRIVRVDTLYLQDTLRERTPTAVRTKSLGLRRAYLRKKEKREEEKDVTEERDEERERSEGEIDSEEMKRGEGGEGVAVDLPITQKEYEGEDYRAWVSGYEANLDSIYIKRDKEIVRIKEETGREMRKKRWGIGVYAGYGLTREGPGPSIGICINYNIIEF